MDNGPILLDGEVIGDILHIFDLHVYQGKRIHDQPWITRMLVAKDLLCGYQQLKVIPVAVTMQEKLALWDKVKREHGEGVVFKLIDSPVTEGRPNTGGDYLKPEQRWQLFLEHLGQRTLVDKVYCQTELNRLNNLTPGDFACIRRQLKLMGEKLTPETWITRLQQECRAKPDQGGRTMGFL